MKYIAYGSNMVQEQMAFRCPDARLIGTGYISGARLEFYLHATVERTGDQRNRVPVAVWEINDRDERSLDRYEGYPSYYIKERWPVHMSDGSQIEGMIYIMKMIRQSAGHTLVRQHLDNTCHRDTRIQPLSNPEGGFSRLWTAFKSARYLAHVRAVSPGWVLPRPLPPSPRQGPTWRRRGKKEKRPALG